MKLSLNFLNQYVDLKNIDIYRIVDAIEKCICPVISCKKTDTDDTVIEIRPRLRGDLLGHYGIAREISAIFKLKLKELPITKIKNPIPMERLENDEAWNRICIQYKNEAPLPDGIIELLSSCEISSKKRYGELWCEYIMLELGVPMQCKYEKMGAITIVSSVGDPTRQALNGISNERSKRYIYSQYVNFAIERLMYLLNDDCTIYTLTSPKIEPETEYLITKNDVSELYGSEEIWAESEEIFKALGLLKYKKSSTELVLRIPYWRNPIDLNHKVSFIRELIRIYSYTHSEDGKIEDITQKDEIILPKDKLRFEMERLSIKESYIRAFTENNGRIELRKCLCRTLSEKSTDGLAYEIGRAYGNGEEEHICVTIEKSLFGDMIGKVLKGIEDALDISLDFKENIIYCNNKKIGEALPLYGYICVELNITDYLGTYL